MKDGRRCALDVVRVMEGGAIAELPELHRRFGASTRDVIDGQQVARSTVLRRGRPQSSDPKRRNRETLRRERVEERGKTEPKQTKLASKQASK